MTAQDSCFSVDLEQVPEPLDRHYQYTRKELQRRIAWVKAKQKRNLTTLSEHFLQSYLDGLQDGLHDWPGAIEIVERMEARIMYTRYLTAIPNEEEVEMISQSRELIKHRLFGRYGDYRTRT